MSTRLDPRVKNTILNNLLIDLYTPTKMRQETRLKQIIVANSTASMHSALHFKYKGTVYNIDLYPPRFQHQKLLPEYHPVMEEYLAERKQIEYTETPYISGFFRKVLNVSNSIDDYLAMLPECVHKSITGQVIHASHFFPRELTDEQVETFKVEHNDWIMLIKKRMVLELITV